MAFPSCAYFYPARDELLAPGHASRDFTTEKSLFKKKEFLCLRRRPLRDALTHTLAGGMTHTEVNHTYSRAFSPGRSKTSVPVSLPPQKNQTETRRPDSGSPTARPPDSSHLPVSRPPSHSCRCFRDAGDVCRETSGARLVLVFHFRLPP